MMDHKPRPYKGRAAELDTFKASTANSLPHKDTVIEAGKRCLFVGGLVAPLFIGLPFLGAGFALGIYAMATNRLKQGLKISLIATALMTLLPIIIYVIFGVILLGRSTSAFGGIKTMPHSIEAPAIKKREPSLPTIGGGSGSIKTQNLPTSHRPERSTPRRADPSVPAVAKDDVQKPTKIVTENRWDHIIPRNELTHIPGFGSVNINHDHAFIYFSTFKGQKPRRIRKTKGLHPTDSNRTLITKAGSSSLYFVDTIVGASKVQVAVIRE